MKVLTKLVLIACLVLPTVSQPAFAQTILATQFKQRYSLRLVTCYACHVRGEEKDQLCEFGTVVGKLLEDKQITERLDEVRDLEDDDGAKQKVHGEIVQEFTEALRKLDELVTPSGKTYAEAISAGDVEGAKPRK